MRNLLLLPLYYITKKRILLTLALIAAGVIVAFASLRDSKNTSPVISAQTTSKIQIQPAKATATINKEFSFPIKDSNEREVGKINYLVDRAEKRDEIVVKGQKATAISGRTFLIINLKITNESKQKIQMNTRDYIRLSLDGNPEWLAPDIHNDPVEIQAISTKYTRIGFPTPDNVTSFKLQAGEINGEKTTIGVSFK